jgi:hypothetical protein
MQTGERPGVPVRFREMLVMAAFALLLVSGCGGGGSLGAKSLAKQSGTLQSLAAEGALLAHDSAAGRSLGIFRREQAASLSEAAAAAETSLKHARTTPALRRKLGELARIAARVHGDLERLKSASKAEQRTLGRALEADAKQSERIGTELG